MNRPDDEEDPHRRDIAEEILSLPAKEVLRYDKLKDPLSYLLNMEGALKNWKDVATKLDYKPARILGDFTHRDLPGFTLLEDWIYNKKGTLQSLVQVFMELKMFSCLEVVGECVEEYEARTARNTNNPSESDEIDNSEAQFQGRYGSDVDTSLSTDGSLTCASRTMDTSMDYTSSVQTSSPSSDCLTPSLPPLVVEDEWTCNGSFIANIQDTNCSLSCDDLEHGEEHCKEIVASKLPFLRAQSWSPTETCHLGKQPNLLHPMGGEQSLLNRSLSQPNNVKSKAGLDTKRKSFRKRIARIFRKKKKNKQSPINSSAEEVNCSSPGNLASSNACFTRSESLTVAGSYREAPEKHVENLSPLKVEEARRSSDSLSSGESLSNPTSPGYESGYISSEGPTVSSGKSISIIHCFDLEDEAYQNECWKLYNHFNEELGYKCHLDKPEMLQITEHKFRYALRRVKQTDFVFICVSPQLKRIFDSSFEEISDLWEDDSNCMLRLESDLILSELANSGSNRKGKFMTILLEGSSKSDVPCFLESFMVYRWPKDERKIRCIIEEKPEIMPAPVSCVKTDPPSRVIIPAKLI